VTTGAAIGYWALLSAGYHLGWEVLQLPLYTIWQSDASTIVFAVAHCTGGDVLIAVSTYAFAAAVARSWRWPVQRAALGVASAMAAGVLYVVFSEWLNVSVLGSWAYAQAMPVVAGIGLSPLLQWVVVPLIVLLTFRLTMNGINHGP